MHESPSGDGNIGLSLPVHEESAQEIHITYLTTIIPSKNFKVFAAIE